MLIDVVTGDGMDGLTIEVVLGQYLNLGPIIYCVSRADRGQEQFNYLSRWIFISYLLNLVSLGQNMTFWTYIYGPYPSSRS